MHELIIAMPLSPTINIYTVRGGHCTSKTLRRFIPPWKLAANVQQCKFPHVQWTELSHSHQCLQGITYFTVVPIRTYFELWSRRLAQDGAAAYNLLLEPVITLRNGPQHLHFPLGIESHIPFRWQRVEVLVDTGGECFNVALAIKRMRSWSSDKAGRNVLHFNSPQLQC